MDKYAEITRTIIGAAMRVHGALGPGFLESVYKRAMVLELGRAGLAVQVEKSLSVIYESDVVGDFTPDLLVERVIVVELKAVQAIATAHEVQTVHYLTATGIDVGLLLNFGAPSLQFKRKHPDRHSHYHPLYPVHPPPALPVHPVQKSPVVTKPLIDISRPLFTGSPHWPGDTDTSFRLSLRIAEGKPCNLGTLRLSVHNGTHADAPFHYNDRGTTIDALPPEHFVGPARVIDARGQASLHRGLFDGLSAADLAATPRILFRTDAWLDLDTFPSVWPLLDRDLPAWLASQGVTLMGLDLPSVDPLTNTDMAIHHLLDAANILILESLDLRDVVPGCYELIALPLKLRGGDGSPVRAVLRAM